MSEDVELVPAGPDDCEAVWRINNDPAARAQSVQTASIPWGDHVAWYERVLADSDQRLWAAREPGGQTVGVVRFRIDEAGATISIALDAAWRGKGLGRRLIAQAGAKLWAERPDVTLWAYVRATNGASLRAFVLAGYEEVDEQRLEDGGQLKRLKCAREARPC